MDRMTPLTDCADNIKCPRILMTSRGTLIVQGLRIHDNRVRIPSALVPEALGAYRSLVALGAAPLPGEVLAKCEIDRPGEFFEVTGAVLADDEALMLAMPPHETAVEISLTVLEGAE